MEHLEALRIILHQNMANYRKEETVENKMTYPLPPFSTVIGALHNACGYREYHPMDLSVQGRNGSLIHRPYVDHCFLNSTQDDRGILVKMSNENLLSTAFEEVARAKKSQGNSFRDGITIQVLDEQLLQEYRDLKALSVQIQEFANERIKPIQTLIKERKKTLARKKADTEKGSTKHQAIINREQEIRRLEKEISQRLKDYEEEQYKKPIARFRTLTKSLKYYEVLTNVELVIHIKSDRETLHDIMEHVYDLKSIGRSEDFVEVVDVRMVDLLESAPCEVESPYGAYIDYNLVRNGEVFSRVRKGSESNGTKYYLNKKYEVKDGRREFEKKKVLYMSGYCVDEESAGIYLDCSDGEKKYIVSFL